MDGLEKKMARFEIIVDHTTYSECKSSDI